jgi:transcriptional regulator of acetoin/glycerol metabolism
MTNRLTPRFKTALEVKQEHFLSVLQALDWNLTKAAAALAISRRTLHRRLDAWGMSRRSPNDGGAK